MLIYHWEAKCWCTTERGWGLLLVGGGDYRHINVVDQLFGSETATAQLRCGVHRPRCDDDASSTDLRRTSDVGKSWRWVTFLLFSPELEDTQLDAECDMTDSLGFVWLRDLVATHYFLASILMKHHESLMSSRAEEGLQNTDCEPGLVMLLEVDPRWHNNN